MTNGASNHAFFKIQSLTLSSGKMIIQALDGGFRSLDCKRNHFGLRCKDTDESTRLNWSFSKNGFINGMQAVMILRLSINLYACGKL